MARGINYWVSKTDSSSIFLIGNPIVWIPAYLSILGYLLYELVDLILQQRKLSAPKSGYFRDMIGGCWFFSAGFFLHYLPFFLMSRQLFIHHYLPALYFSILVLGGVFDLLTHKFKKPVQMFVYDCIANLSCNRILVACLLVSVVYVFYLTLINNTSIKISGLRRSFIP